MIIVQSRMTSTRLPGKVLMPLGDKPLLERMIERLRKSAYGNKIIIATTWQPADNPVAELGVRLHVPVFRGHPDDLLDRHYQAAREFGLDYVVKIPSDCPLIDPQVVDFVIDSFFSEGNLDYAGNLHPATWPDGNDVEIFTTAALERAWREAQLAHQREHTTPYLFENPQIFRLKNIVNPKGSPELPARYRLTIDYPEDYQLISAVFENLYPVNPDFGWNDIVQFLEAHPAVHALNAMYAGTSWMSRHYEKLPVII